MATNVIKMQIQFRRDTTANWEAHKEIVPAAGEPCFDIELGTLKIGDGIKNYGQLKPIGGDGSVSVSADGKSLILEDGIFKLAGFDAAEVGAQPTKTEDGIKWIVPSTDALDSLQSDVTTLKTNVATLESTVTEIKEIVTPSGDGATTLLSRVEGLEHQMDGTGNGTVDAKIDAKINEFINDISDDGTVNTLKELVDYVAAHGVEAADMAADITTLQGLVGDTKVSVQIDTAVAGLVKAEVDKGLSTNDFTDSLLEKLEGIEGGAQVNKIEEIYLGDNLLEVVDKKIVLPVGAGLKASDEITVAEDGTLGIGKISFSKIAQAENETVIMDGGGAAG